MKILKFINPKLFFYLGISIFFISCSIKLNSKIFFSKPYSRIRLLETENLSKTNLTYKVENIKINDSINIETWIIEPKTAENIFFLFSPSESSIAISSEIMEKIALNTNSKVIGIQYRGYNYSTGNPNISTSFYDNDLIFKYYSENLEKFKTVNLIGMSIGTVFLSKVVKNNENKIDNIFLLSTFSTPKMMKKEIKKMNVPWFIRPFIGFKIDKELININNIKELENYKNGIMIFQAKDDKTTGYGMALEIFNKTKSIKKELITFENGGHGAPYSQKYLDDVIKNISRFMKL